MMHLIPVDLLFEALQECYAIIRSHGFEPKKFCVICDDDGVTIKFVIPGEYDELLKLWDKLSQRVSEILMSYGKYVFVEVEPYACGV